MTEIVITPPTTLSITATSPNAYTITATQPAPITITVALGASGTVTSVATTAPITGGTITGAGTIGISAATTAAAGSMSASDKTKLDGIEAGAEVNNISDVNATDLTDGGSTTLHSHANDHARQHSITSTSDHTSTATSGQMLKADANGLPVNATNTDAQVSAAVTASHAAVTIADTASIDMTLTGQQVSAAAIFGTGAGVVAEGNHTHTGVYQPADAQLTDVAGLTPTDNGVIIGNGSNFVVESGATLKASLGLTIGTDIPAIVNPSVADNFVSFSNTTGAQKDSGKGLTHLVYTLQYGGYTGTTLADSTSYYIGGSGTINTDATEGKIYFPMAGTVVWVDFINFVNGTLGTNETASVNFRLNNTTNTLISNALTANAVMNRVQADVSIAVSAGDYFEILIATPAYTTNPTLTRQYGTLMVRI